MAGTKSAPVKYSKGGVRADTRQLDQKQKATDTSLEATRAALAVEEIPVFIEYPENKDYRIIVASKYARTINEITTVCSTGTATVTGKINSTNLGGTANSASTTEQTQTHSSANSVAVGDDIVLTISAVSSIKNLSINIKATRTL